jgi:hypothetical protein
MSFAYQKTKLYGIICLDVLESTKSQNHTQNGGQAITFTVSNFVEIILMKDKL